MTETHRDYRLSTESGDYVNARLRAGNALASAVAERYRASGDECATRLPDGVAPEVLVKFTEGGTGDSDESDRWLVEIIQAYLSEGADRAVVVEDALSRRGDAVLDRLQSRVRFYNDEVYRVLTPSDNSDYAIKVTLSEADASYQLVCVFTRTPGNADDSCDEIKQEELESWCDATEAVAVRAYDGEGYVFCSGLSRS